MITHSELRRALKHYYASKSWCSWFSKDPQVIDSLKNFINELAKSSSIYSREYLPTSQLFNLFCILTANPWEFSDNHLEDFFKKALPQSRFDDFEKLRAMALELRRGREMTHSNFLEKYNSAFNQVEEDRIVYKYGR